MLWSCRVSAIPLLLIITRNGEVINDSVKKPVDSASSSEEEMTKLYNKWICKALEIKGLPVPTGLEVSHAVVPQLINLSNYVIARVSVHFR